MVPKAVRNWLEENGYGEVLSQHPVGGGCINNGARLQTASGVSFFLKTNSNAPADMFACEAEGLEALRVEDGPRVPAPFAFGSNYLLLEDLVGPNGGRIEREKDYWPNFGRQLAALHNHTNDRFGFLHDNYIGSTPQPNPWTEDGTTFFGQHRLLYQANLAQQHGLLGGSEMRQVENITSRLDELIPEQPASLIHGDLWSGNAMPDGKGKPAIIDPAAHYGWAEAELGMTALFGAFPEAFYRAYQEVRPLEEGLWKRFPLYNLYHLLNHLNLFGSSYLGQVVSILKRFG